MPTMTACFLAGFTNTRWIESASECITSSPGRAPLPTMSSTMGLEPESDGVKPACALPTASPVPWAEAATGPPDPPRAEPAVHANNANTANTAARLMVRTPKRWGTPNRTRDRRPWLRGPCRSE